MANDVSNKTPDMNTPVSEDEQRYRLLFDTSPIGIGIAGTNGVILDANPAIAEIFRCTAEEFIGANILSHYVDPSDRELLLEQMKKSEKIVNYELHLKRKDGTDFWASVTINGIKINGKDAIQTTMVDITDRKERENLAEREKSNYIATTDDSPLPILIVSLDREFKYGNKAAMELFGYREMNEFIISPVSSRYSPESTEQIEEWWNGALSGRPEFMAGHMYEVIRTNGEKRIVRMFNKPIYWDEKECEEIFYIDVTEQYRKDNELQALNGASRAVLSSENFTGTVREIFNHCREVTDAESGFIVLLDDESQEDIVFIEIEGLPYNVDPLLAMPVQGLRAEVYRSQRTMYDNKISERERVRALPEGHIKLHNIMCVPLIVGEKTLGMIVLANKPEDFTDDDGSIVTSIAEICVMALVNHRNLERIEASEAKYRLLFTGVSEGFALHEMIYDEEGSPVDYRYVEVNPAFMQMMDYSGGEIAGKTAREIISPDEGEITDRINLYAQVVETGEPLRFEQYSVVLDKWFSESAFRTRPGQFGTILQDITEAKQAEESLMNDATRKRILIDQSRDGIVVLDTEGNLFEANKRFGEMLGYMPEELSGLSVFDWETMYNQEQFLDSFSTLDQTGGVIETRHRRKDGTLYDVEISANAAYISGEKYIFCVCKDISEKKQIENALHEAEESFRKSIEDSPFFIQIFSKQGDLLYINKAGLELSGFSSMEEYSNILQEKLLTPDSYADFPEWQKIREAGGELPAHFRTNIVRKDGSVRYLDSFRSEVFWDGNYHDQVLYEDITERILAEEHLKNSIITSPLSIWLFDMKGNLVFLNPKALEVTGCESVEEFLAIPNEERLTPESYQDVMRWNKDEEEGKPLPARFSLNIVQKNGEIRNLRGFRNEIIWEGEPHIQIVYEDITDQVRLEVSLAESETRFRQLFENMTSGVALYEPVDDGKDFVFVGFNKAAEVIDDIPREQLLGEKVTEVFPEIEKFGLLEVFRRVWKTGHEETYPVSMYEDDRISGWRENRVYRLPSGEIVSIYDDLTEIKQAEERENRLREELIMQSRLATVGEMAAGIAHEINNPLTGVIGFAALLLEQGVPPEIEEEMKMIYEGSQRVASITSRMLAFARQQQPELRNMNINEVLDTTLAMRSYEIDMNNIKVTKQFADGLDTTMADSTQIQQVFLNILLNAESVLKKTGRGGNITIRTGEADGLIKVSISDDGPGIPAEIMDRLFDPFFTTNPVGEGTGLGLSVSYGIIKRHGGNIYAVSEPGEGATFVVELPVIQNSGVEQEPSISETMETKTGTRILLIDDENMVQRYLEGLLNRQGYRLDIAITGEEGLEKLKENEYDVILLDVRLPGISGIEVYNILQRERSGWTDKILLITGDVMNEETVNFIHTNDIPYVEKPFKSKVILEKINLTVQKNT